jgi:arylsulfatase A
MEIIMKMGLRIVFLGIMAAVLIAASANAAVIVSENFGGSGVLNGTAADTFSPAITAAGGSDTWVAASGFLGNGAVSVNKNAAYLNLGSYIQDAKGTAAGLFELTLTISQTTGAWLSLGFGQENTPSTNKDFTNSSSVGDTGTTNGIGTIIYRDADNELDMFVGPGITNAVDGPNGNTGSRTLTVKLDFTPAGGYGSSNYGTMTWSDSVLGELGSYSLTAGRTFGSLLITGAATSTGTIGNLTLTQSGESSPVLTFENVITTQALLPAFLSASVSEDLDPNTSVFTLLTDDSEFPTGATAELTNTTVDNRNPTATLEPNMPGTYKVRLEVSDGTTTVQKIAEVVVYANACEAQKNAPSGWAGDYFDTNEDCIVNLLDLADMADKWLHETSMTTQETFVRKPNIVFVLADDMGIECLSTYGGTSHQTPNIDTLASQGMRFTYCFSNPFCSPSRGSLLTGRYPFKNGLTTVLSSVSQENIYLSPDQPSFARQLKQAGYATAISGKWHVSLLHKHDTINEFGFDQYQVWQIFDENLEKTRRYWSPYLNRNGTILGKEAEGKYGPDLNVAFLIDFMETQAQRKKPFLAYYSTPLPHFPWEPTPDSPNPNSYRVPNNDHKGDPQYFPDMVKYLDKNVGRLMQTVEDLGIADNTIFIFLADNGTDRDLYNHWGAGYNLRGGKGTMTDRGTHVPLIVRWPGHIAEGTTCNDLVDFSDFLPTFCELAGAPMPDDDIHGRSFLPQLLSEPGNPREWVHVQHEGDRHIRNMEYILNNQNELRPVVEIWQDPALPLAPGEEPAARAELQAVFDYLGN